jgi:hypothetical protein
VRFKEIEVDDSTTPVAGQPPRYSVGWDVEAWNCDSGSSRDALVVLEEGADGPITAGRPWRGNLRSVLDAGPGGADLILAVLSLCGVTPLTPFEATVAIDTPLGWPKPMLDLLTAGVVVPVPERADENPYLFRQAELALFGHDHRPLSAVRDMIGSQSTKGLHFLSRAGLVRSSVGVWQRGEGGNAVTAIETYPAPCRKSKTAGGLHAGVVTSPAVVKACSKSPNVRADVTDAAMCAVVAWLYANRHHTLQAPVASYPVEEGWIWLPADCLPA